MALPICRIVGIGASGPLEKPVQFLTPEQLCQRRCLLCPCPWLGRLKPTSGFRTLLTVIDTRLLFQGLPGPSFYKWEEGDVQRTSRLVLSDRTFSDDGNNVSAPSSTGLATEHVECVTEELNSQYSLFEPI